MRCNREHRAQRRRNRRYHRRHRHRRRKTAIWRTKCRTASQPTSADAARAREATENSRTTHAERRRRRGCREQRRSPARLGGRIGPVHQTPASAERAGHGVQIAAFARRVQPPPRLLVGSRRSHPPFRQQQLLRNSVWSSSLARRVHAWSEDALAVCPHTRLAYTHLLTRADAVIMEAGVADHKVSY